MSLRRLLSVRQLEEEQCRTALESALGEIHQLKTAISESAERDRRGRALFFASAYSGELPDRIASLEETRSAACATRMLMMRIKATELEVARMRQNYLAKRVERRQVETLLEKTEEQGAIESSRRGQKDLDDWHRSRARTAHWKSNPSGNAKST